MRITILAVGTRGDVQPYIALGLGLKEAGHDVHVASPSNFEQFILSYGLRYERLEGNFRELMESDTMQALASSRNPIQAYREMTKALRHVLECFTADSWKACQRSDGIIFSSIAVTGYSVAEKLGVPSCWAPLQPMSRTRAFPSTIFAGKNHNNEMLNWISHIIEDQLTWQPSRKFINEWRQNVLGLRPYPFLGPFDLLDKKRFPIIYGYSPSVLPKPREWRDWIHVTGYWFLNHSSEWQASEALRGFLEAGPSPIYVGFGSMNNRDAAAMTRLVVEAITQANVRAILTTGWNSLAEVDLPDSIYKIDSIPHDWLFPRTSAIVHHGGAGTTAAGLRAGIPGLIIPHMMDQPFWGQRVFDMGVGPKPIPRKHLTARNVAYAISTMVNNEAMQKQAALLGNQIRAEDGIANAVELIEHYFLHG